MDLKDLRKQLSNMEKDDILKWFGVEERRTTVDYIVPAVGLFSVGLLVGAGLGLMMAPKSGRELRQDLRSRLSSGAEHELGHNGAADAQARTSDRA